jgi:hypothetical protein
VKSNRNTLIIVGSIAAVIVLAGAAFLATRLINRNAAGGAPQPASRGDAGPIGKDGKMAQSGPTAVPSELIPQRDTDVTGTITKIQDNSIFVEAVVLNGVMDPNNQNLPDAEVVVTKDTKILHPAGTETSTDSTGKSVEKKKYEEVTINELAFNDIVQVWGEKRGDRYYADVITYIH